MPRFPRIAIFVTFVSYPVFGQPYIISTVAGTPRLLDGQSAASAPLRSPIAVAVDSHNNLYIADNADNRIRKVSAAGIISTYAGTGLPGYSGDGGPASSARLDDPLDVAIDASGNLYVADRGNARVRRISPAGTISTVAGNGKAGFSGDNGPAILARIDPVALAIDNQNNLYIADGDNYRIRKVDSNGVINTIAGTGTPGYTGDNGPASIALISFVTGLAVDSTGNLYVADLDNLYVRKIDTSGQITTVAGSGGFGRIDDGVPATQAVMLPAAVALDGAGNLYIADINRSVIRRVDLTTGLIFTTAGNGTAGFAGDNATARNAELDGPTGLAIANNQIFIADLLNTRIREVAGGIISTVAGTGTGDGGPAISAFLNYPQGLAVDAFSNIVIADTGDYSTRRFMPGSTIGVFGQVPSTPYAVGIDPAGNFYVTDEEPRVFKITPTGATSIVAGNGQDGYTGDNGTAIQASISFPTGVASDGTNVYLTDYNHSRIRKVDATGKITTIAGNGNHVFSGDGGPALSAGLDPYDIALDTSGNLYVADFSNNRIRKITPNGQITTVAGTGNFGYGGDGGPATSATITYPTGVALDSSGNLLIADNGNSVIRRVNTNGLITTIAGIGLPYPATGDSGPAIAAQLDPWRITVDRAGDLYVSDYLNDAVRKLTPQAVIPAAISIVSGNNQSGPAGTLASAPLIVRVTDRNGAALSGVVINFSVSSGSATLNPSQAITISDGSASTHVTFPATPASVTITAAASGLTGTVSFSLTAISTTAPAIASGGIVSAGLSIPAVQSLAPNAIVSIFGTNFAPAGTARQVGPGDLVNGAIPTNLAGICVAFGTVRAPVLGVFSAQLNVQVPQLASGATTVQVITGCDTPQSQTSNAVNVNIAAAAPEFFYFVHNADGHNPIAAINAITGAYIGTPSLIIGTSFQPTQAGDYLTLFATGFGATDPPVAPGQLATGTANVTAAVSIVFGGVTLSPSDILYVGLTQNAGLYQVNIQVPDNVPAGDQSFVITIGGVSSPAGGFLTVAQP